MGNNYCDSKMPMYLYHQGKFFSINDSMRPVFNALYNACVDWHGMTLMESPKTYQQGYTDGFKALSDRVIRHISENREMRDCLRELVKMHECCEAGCKDCPYHPCEEKECELLAKAKALISDESVKEDQK